MLAESFVREDTLVAVVGTLSPAAADAEHSLATMRTICSLAGEDARVTETREEVRPIREEVRRQPPQKIAIAHRHPSPSVACSTRHQLSPVFAHHQPGSIEPVGIKKPFLYAAQKNEFSFFRFSRLATVLVGCCPQIWLEM